MSVVHATISAYLAKEFRRANLFLPPQACDLLISHRLVLTLALTPALSPKERENGLPLASPIKSLDWSN